MKKILWAALLLCAACSSDPTNEWEEIWNPMMPDMNEGGGGFGGGDMQGSVDATGALLDFDVTWDDVSEATFTEAAETVVTDENSDEYDDFVENSSFKSKIEIAYAGTAATVSGSVEGVTVTAEGGHVTVDSTVSGVEYVLSGTATDGSFKIYSEKKFKLTLNDVSLTSQQSAAINIQSKKRVFIHLADGTQNSLTDAEKYTNTVDGEDQKACLFSEGQLIFSGSGALTVNGHYKHGICSDEYVRLRTGCRLTIASAVKDGIHTNDGIIVSGGVLTLTVSGDGLDCEEGYIYIRGGLIKADIPGTASKAVKAETDISISGGQLLLLTSGDGEYDSDDQDISSSAAIKCNGNLTISDATISIKSTGAAGKGINCDGTLDINNATMKVITEGKQYIYGSLDSSAKGIKADGNLTINSGTIWVKTTGGEGSEGIESKSEMTINGGEVLVYSYDDCLNASNSIVINGGNVYCYSSGNDGIDSNGTLTVTGGTVVASGTTSPEEGIDCDQNTFKITGGTLLGIGGGTSSPTTNACTQRSVIYGGTGNSGTLITIATSTGTHVMSYTVPRNYQQMSLLFSSDKLTSGTSYTIYTGGSVTGGTSFYGLTTGGTYTAGTSATTFTATNMVTTAGNVSSGGPGVGGGGMPGGGGGWHW